MVRDTQLHARAQPSSLSDAGGGGFMGVPLLELCNVVGEMLEK